MPHQAGLIGGISRKVLTQTLRRLQQYGLVERHAEAPRRVEYRPTDLGQTLVEPIGVLTNRARDYGGAIVDFQEAAEATTSARARRGAIASRHRRRPLGQPAAMTVTSWITASVRLYSAR